MYIFYIFAEIILIFPLQVAIAIGAVHMNTPDNSQWPNQGFTVCAGMRTPGVTVSRTIRNMPTARYLRLRTTAATLMTLLPGPGVLPWKGACGSIAILKRSFVDVVSDTPRSNIIIIKSKQYLIVIRIRRSEIALAGNVKLDYLLVYTLWDYNSNWSCLCLWWTETTPTPWN